jgi:peptide/nickel transport system permease protein
VLLFAAKRIVWAAVMLLAVSLVTFVIFFVLPAAPVRAGGRGGTEEVAIRDAYDFSGPLYVEYAQFVKGIVVDGSLGRSLSNRQDVTEILWRGAPVTLSLMAGGLLLMLLIAVPVGVLSALRPRSRFDRSAMALVLIGVSAHPVWIGLILAYLLGFKLGAFPIAGYCDVIDPGGDCGGPVQWAWHLVLPWFTFAILFAAIYARMIRASVLEVLGEDYVRTARGKGAGEGAVLRGHVLRNASLPIVAMLGVSMAELGFVGVLFVERVYGLPGLGGVMLEGLRRRDPPLVLGVVVFSSVAIVLVNLVADLLYTAIDPRIRLREGSAGVRLRGRARGEEAPAPASAPV